MEAEDRFFVFEIDLPNDDLGPRAAPAQVSEIGARARLAELGLAEAEIDARIGWARRWMATLVVPAGAEPAGPPPL